VLGLRRHRVIPCLGCGYDVTGLAPESVCPECALPLKSTLEASNLLRTCPREMVRGYRIGTWLLALSPTCLVLGLALGLWIGLIWWALSDSGGWTGVAIGVVAGSCGSAVALIAGTELMIRSTRGRSLHPAWGLRVLRVAGPVVIAITSVGLVVRLNGLVLGRVSDVVLRATFQVAALTALASLLRVAESVWSQTQATVKRPRREWLCWVVISGLALIWTITTWLLPITTGPFARPWRRLVLGTWAEPLAVIAFILLGTFLWRLVDAVSLEWSIREYTSKRPDSAYDQP
jgi:hypothetical protein